MRRLLPLLLVGVLLPGCGALTDALLGPADAVTQAEQYETELAAAWGKQAEAWTAYTAASRVAVSVRRVGLVSDSAWGYYQTADKRIYDNLDAAHRALERGDIAESRRLRGLGEQILSIAEGMIAVGENRVETAPVPAKPAERPEVQP